MLRKNKIHFEPLSILTKTTEKLKQIRQIQNQSSQQVHSFFFWLQTSPLFFWATKQNEQNPKQKKRKKKKKKKKHYQLRREE